MEICPFALRVMAGTIQAKHSHGPEMHLIIFIADALVAVGSCAFPVRVSALLVLYQTITLKVNGRVSRLG